MASLSPIQTPLISQEYIKALGWKRFTVVSDSLAPIMWRGYDLICLPTTLDAVFKEDALLVVECRIAGRKTCSYQVGFFNAVNAQTLTLDYESSRLKQFYGLWSVPVAQIKRVWQVDKVVRWYAHLRKFYPYDNY